MAAIVYLLGALATLCCAILLLRGYAGSRRKLLLWSGLCFVGLTISNLLVFVDLKMFPGLDLFRWRLGTRPSRYWCCCTDSCGRATAETGDRHA